MTHDIARTADYRGFIRSLKQKAQSAQIKAARALNTQLIGLYWDLGMLIAEKQRAAGWGDAVIEQIAHDLTRELGGVKGFSRRNLYRIKQWYSFYADQDEFVPQLVAQIWYVRKTLENNWSRNVLAHQIDTRPFERQGAKTGIDNFSERLPIPDSDLARESLKDPYVFDFLGVGEEARERALEEALTEHLTRFMLELGKGFAFVGMQIKDKGKQPMNIPILTTFFMWCAIINGGILILWTMFFVFAPDFVYRIQNKWFPIPRETYNVVVYSFLGLFKIVFLLFNVVPYMALLIVG